MDLLEYVETEFATFREKPFNELDAAVFSQLCMIQVELPCCATPMYALDSQGFLTLADTESYEVRLSLRDLLCAEHFADMFTGLAAESIKKCLIACAASPRFREVAIVGYQALFDHDQAIQFSATTYETPEFVYVAFRGTDCSLAGWREDFNLAYMHPIPSQALAQFYVGWQVGRMDPLDARPLYVGGHSKGGNLAEFVALTAPNEYLATFDHVYSFDGPGFKARVFSEADFGYIAERFSKFVPQDSVIGMVLDSSSAITVVHSNERAVGQHDVFTWEIEDGAFVREEGGLSKVSIALDDVTRDWMHSYTDDDLAAFVAALFRALEASGTTDVQDLLVGGARTREVLLAAVNSVEGEDEVIINHFIKDFREIFRSYVATQAGEALKNWAARKNEDAADHEENEER